MEMLKEYCNPETPPERAEELGKILLDLLNMGRRDREPGED